MKTWKTLFIPFSMMITALMCFQLWVLFARNELTITDVVIRIVPILATYGLYIAVLAWERQISRKVNLTPLLMTATDDYVQGTMLLAKPTRYKVMLSGKNSELHHAVADVVLHFHKLTPSFHPSPYVVYRIDSYGGHQTSKKVSETLTKIGVAGAVEALHAKSEEDLLTYARNNPYRPTKE